MKITSRIDVFIINKFMLCEVYGYGVIVGKGYITREQGESFSGVHV